MGKYFGWAPLLLIFALGIGFAQEKMIITFKDGRAQTLDTNTIQKIEFRSTPASTEADCWTGHFSGTDSSGYAIDINLSVKNGVVEGGYSYYHKAQGQSVTAIITNTLVTGDVLRGNWKQTKGVVAEGKFEWTWLPNRKCAAFEGSFDGTKFWTQMIRR